MGGVLVNHKSICIVFLVVVFLVVLFDLLFLPAFVKWTYPVADSDVSVVGGVGGQSSLIDLMHKPYDRLLCVMYMLGGLTLHKGGDYQNAVIYFDKALDIDPNYAELWKNKGNALSSQGRYEDALNCYEKALEINCNHGMAWKNKGIALQELGRFEEALECYNRALELYPHSAVSQKNKEYLEELLKNGTST